MTEKNTTKSGQDLVIGVDYGTDSVRSVLVDASNGNELSSAIYYYPRWKEGKYCIPSANQFRQHPLDYMEGLEFTILECLKKAGALRLDTIFAYRGKRRKGTEARSLFCGS